MMDKRRGGGMRRKKVCQFCADKSEKIDYKDVEKLRRYITERGKILPKNHRYLRYASERSNDCYQESKNRCTSSICCRLIPKKCIKIVYFKIQDAQIGEIMKKQRTQTVKQ